MPFAAMIKRIRRFFGGNTPFTEGVRVVVNTEKLEQRVALVENGMLEEYTIERTGTQHIATRGPNRQSTSIRLSVRGRNGTRQ